MLKTRGKKSDILIAVQEKLHAENRDKGYSSSLAGKKF